MIRPLHSTRFRPVAQGFSPEVFRHSIENANQPARRPGNADLQIGSSLCSSLPCSLQISAHLRVSALSFLLIFSPLLFLSACSQKSPSANSTATLFPDSNAVPNWTRSPDIRTYPPAQLPDYIDGDAEKYLRVNVQSTSTVDYKFQNKFEATADIYSFSESTGAKSIFDSEPAANATTPQLGDAARLYEQSLTFRKGRFLVRIVAYEANPLLQNALLELGKSIDQKLPK